ncbi:hypothetical protein Cgig2_001023 [Carnegiea gigantea]|uniref:Uncharacterized protein n=1 Tax=Carnegiea gigantea TaxID=171969 RepID=A0A9Q1GUZ8_9CARY|nr:hypothetical protein Cgig2_001023 [Carnegiea gigantea]
MQIRVWTCPCTVALPSPSPNSKAHFLICLNFPTICSSNVICNQFPMKNSTAIKALSASNNGDEVGDRKNGMAKASGTSARGRRLLKLREEKRRREHERLNTYPAWAKVLEDGCKHDAELRAVLGDSIGNPEEMRKREGNTDEVKVLKRLTRLGTSLFELFDLQPTQDFRIIQ